MVAPNLILEAVLQDLAVSYDEWSISVLRYFNPIGAHPSRESGEDPKGLPNNLLPFVAQVASGVRDSVLVFGGDYPTKDGTGVRDYIHVVDLARGHIKALEFLDSNRGVLTCNLGTGTGYFVFDVLKAFERASGRKVPYTLVDRRPGGVAQCFADPKYAKQVLGWQAEFDLDRMCEDAWRWQRQYPNGYKDEH